MQNREKKLHILRLLDLGLGFYESCLHANMTDAEIEEAENDPEFMREADRAVVVLEEKLLSKINSGMLTEIAKGTTTTARWLLEKINPERWGNRAYIEGNLKGTEAPDPINIKTTPVHPGNKDATN